MLIAGGGVAALEAALALRHLAEERVSVTIVAPEPRFWYRPLAVVEPFGGGRLHGVDLAELADECGALFEVDALATVDAEAHVAHTTSGAEFEYDALLVATGAKPVAAVPGAFTFRGPADVEAFSTPLAAVERRLVFAVPGGVAWPLPLYELALQTASAVPGAELTLVTHEDEPLGVFGAAATEAARELLDRRGIMLRTATYAVEFEHGALALAPGARSPPTPWSRCRASRACRSQGFLPTPKASFPSTRAAGCGTSTTSSPPATPSHFRSSRAASPRSRPTRPPRRSPPRPARRSSRSRSGRCCAGCS
ncbi:MAG TPA: FAD/NAD(P)-binding oxidoreductase [Gaiellaceae bacterium]|nr:FAD/NAD(P)-binding oxidoreductase [Gaiellaceae bacterium]